MIAGRFCFSLLLSVITAVHCAEIPLTDFETFKQELEEVLIQKIRHRGRSTSALVLTKANNDAESSNSNRSQSTSPSIKRAKTKIRSSSSSPKLEKSCKRVDELVFTIKHSEDIAANKKMIAHALALLLKQYWLSDKKITAFDIDIFIKIIESVKHPMADCVQGDKLVELLIPDQVKGKVNQVINLPITNTGLTLLLEAAKNSKESLTLIEKLLQLGADVAVKDFFKNTVFHYLAKGVAYADDKKAVNSVVALLVKHGGNINDVDETGKTALDWAVKLDSKIIAEVLIGYGAVSSKTS